MIKHLIFVDLEFTVGKKHQKYFSPEVIQIGAVKVTKDFEEISRFNKFVKPERNATVNEYLTRLTGISQEQINNANTFNMVYQEFEDWVGDMSEVSFVFWGKEDIRILTKEIEDKKYNGKLIINKFFNFQSYLWSKTGKKLSLKTASELFQSNFEGTPHNALWDAVNLKNLYVQVISSSDVNKLWFEGKMKYIIDQLMELADYFAQSEDFRVDIRKAMALSNKCSVMLEISSSFSGTERENKLAQIRSEMDEIQNDIETVVLKKFREDTMILQWAVMKGRLPQKFETAEEMLNYWSEVSDKYKFFRKNRRGNYAIRFEQVKKMSKLVGNRVYNFYQSQRDLPVDVNWFTN